MNEVTVSGFLLHLKSSIGGKHSQASAVLHVSNQEIYCKIRENVDPYNVGVAQKMNRHKKRLVYYHCTCMVFKNPVLND